MLTLSLRRDTKPDTATRATALMEELLVLLDAGHHTLPALHVQHAMDLLQQEACSISEGGAAAH